MSSYPYPKNIIFPFYHTISDKNCPHIKNLYPVKSISQFEEELDYFQKNFNPIGLIDILEHIKNHTQPERPSFFLSFDDGLKECHSIIAPILKNRNLTAAFFINTGFVGNLDLFYRYKISLIIEKLKEPKRKSIQHLLKLNYTHEQIIDSLAMELGIDFNEFLEKEKPYMDWHEIRDLVRQGFLIGGHSVDHPYFNIISFDQQILQTKNSVDSVVNNLGLTYRIFSFPFTDLGVGKKYFDSIYNEGICDLTFGTAGIKEDEFAQNLHRIPMDNCLGSPKRFIEKQRFQYHLKKLIRKHKVIHPTNENF